MNKFTIRQVLENFPEVISQGLQASAGRYRVERPFCAVCGPLPDEIEMHCVANFEHENIHIVRLHAQDVELEVPEHDVLITAVYSLQPSGLLYVPTGRIFIRLKEDKRLQELSGALQALAFVIVDIPDYAPHSGWLEHRSGEIHRALTELIRLKRLEDVENIEPQMLSSRSYRVLQDRE